MANAVSRAVLEVLLDRVHQGAAVISPDGRLTYANQRLASMLGVERSAIVGRPLAGLVAESDREALARALDAGHDTGAQCRVEMPRSNGQGHLQAFLSFAPLGHGQASCLVTDVDQEKRSGVLAHEVRSMMDAARNALEALKSSDFETGARHALEGIERQGSRILDLLNPRQ